MKRTLSHIQINKPWSAIISFFFNARGNPIEERPLGLFRSLLHQLLQQQRDLLATFLPKCRTKRDSLRPGWEWQEGELREYFSDVVTSAQVPSMIVIIDALDECEQESDLRQLVSFIARLTSSAISLQCEFHVCMSSRHCPHISVPGCLEIVVESWNASDIFKYVESELPMENTSGMDFQREVAKKASGVFLWVVLVVTSLHRYKDEGRTVSEMRQILQSVPDEINELFTGYFRTVNAKDRPQTLCLMQWILFAERPLTPTEINCALAFSNKHPPKSQKSWKELDDSSDSNTRIERILRTLSRGLVEVKDDDDKWLRPGVRGRRVVQFIHESVRDILLHLDGLQIIDSSLGHLTVGKSHDLLTKACISYLSIEELQIWQKTGEMLIDQPSDDYKKRQAASDVAQSYRKYEFWDYTVTSIFKHAIQADCAGMDQRHLARMFSGKGQGLFQVWRYFNDCLSVAAYRDIHDSRTVFLHVASEVGLLSSVSELLDCGIDANIEGGRLKFALIAAASGGHEAMIRVLLNHGAKVTTTDGNGATAPHQAAERGYQAMVGLLLEKGADVAAKDKNGVTVLHKAAEGEDGEVVRLLLEKGADVAAKDENGVTVLHKAAERGNGEIVRLLLEKGADVAAKDENGVTLRL